MLGKAVFKTITSLGAVAGIGGISQSVAGQVVSRCADPNLTEKEFEKLIEEVSKDGYELKYVK